MNVAHGALVGCCWGALSAAAPLQDCWLLFRDLLLAATLRAACRTVMESTHGSTFAALWMWLRSQAAVRCTLRHPGGWEGAGIAKELPKPISSSVTLLVFYQTSTAVGTKLLIPFG